MQPDRRREMTATTGLRSTLSPSASRTSKRVLIGLVIVGVTCAQTARSSAALHSRRAAPTARGRTPHAERPGSRGARIDPRYGRLPFGFERNVGQTDSRVDFVARGPRYVVFLAGG